MANSTSDIDQHGDNRLRAILGMRKGMIEERTSHCLVCQSSTTKMDELVATKEEGVGWSVQYG